MSTKRFLHGGYDETLSKVAAGKKWFVSATVMYAATRAYSEIKLLEEDKNNLTNQLYSTKSELVRLTGELARLTEENSTLRHRLDESERAFNLLANDRDEVMQAKACAVNQAEANNRELKGMNTLLANVSEKFRSLAVGFDELDKMLGESL